MAKIPTSLDLRKSLLEDMILAIQSIEDPEQRIKVRVQFGQAMACAYDICPACKSTNIRPFDDGQRLCRDCTETWY